MQYTCTDTEHNHACIHDTHTHKHTNIHIRIDLDIHIRPMHMHMQIHMVCLFLYICTYIHIRHRSFVCHTLACGNRGIDVCMNVLIGGCLQGSSWPGLCREHAEGIRSRFDFARPHAH